MTASTFCQVAIDTPLRQLFDYISPLPEAVRPGVRVRVPFGRREVVGLVMRVSSTSSVPQEKLREVQAVLDEQPLLGEADLALLEWAARYYHHPVGEVYATAVPKALRVVRKRAPRKGAADAQAAPGTAREAPYPLSAAQQRALRDHVVGKARLEQGHRHRGAVDG